MSETYQVKHKGMYRLWCAFTNSVRAVKWLSKNEAAFQQELLVGAALSVVAFYITASVQQALILILALLFVLLTEIVNTAIEAVVDRVGFEHHQLSGLAKDLGSAAVLLSIFMAILVWLVVLL